MKNIDIKRITILFWCLAALSALFGGCAQSDYVPREGDLIFCVGTTDDFSRAITDATAWGDSLVFDHVGIVALEEDGTPYIIEATARRGVTRTDWDRFMAGSKPNVSRTLPNTTKNSPSTSVTLSDAPDSQPDMAGSKPNVSRTLPVRPVVVMRLKGKFPLKEAVERAAGFLGQPYDWSFAPNNGKMYCTELVYESFLRVDGTPLFDARPMSFRDEDGNMPEFWVSLYEKLGEDVPEGLPGTNPNDMSKDPHLTEVWRSF